MPTKKPIYETGLEPEYVVDQIIRVEPMGGGLVRLYIGCERQGLIRVEYTVVVVAEKLAEIGRACLDIAAEAHNLRESMPNAETAH